MTTQHRAEALRALDHAIKRLEDPEHLDGFAWSQLKASLEYARSQIELIQEVKRTRRTPEGE